jgi:hypothetical protein
LNGAFDSLRHPPVQNTTFQARKPPSPTHTNPTAPAPKKEFGSFQISL